MWLFETNKNELRETVDKLDKFYSDDHQVCKILIKISASVTKLYLCRLINHSFQLGAFPESLLLAIFIPIYNEGTKTEESNYPISLLNVFSKIYERIIYNRIYLYFEKFSLISNKYFGFRSKHSTIEALVELTEKIKMDTHYCSFNFFLDLKKAFDTIKHPLLLEKLERYGIRGNTINWIKSYLSNRFQRTFVIGISSGWNGINFGVPQGDLYFSLSI